MPIKRDLDDLSARERAFVAARRANPAAPNWEIAKAAGFKGDKAALRNAALRLMKRGAVTRAIFAPKTKAEAARDAETQGDVSKMTDEEIGKKVRQLYMDLMKAPGVTPSDKIRAATKLGETVRGLFVPIQIDSKQVITLEDLVEGMGGAPRDHRAEDGATQKEAEA